MDKNNQEKLKALDVALTQIEKAYGKGAVMKLGDSGANMNIEVVPTGSLSLDIALGLGGLPKGRIIEIYGPESSGRQLLLFMQLQRFRKEAALQALLMLSMHLILFMQEILVLILIISTYLSRIMESRHLKSLRRWFAQALLIL